MVPPYRYWAFISYSHADAAWSDWLFKALETYRVPRRLVGRAGPLGPAPARLYPVFRDRDELGGSAELSASLVEALKASRFLVVICSPRAARSRWVDEEVRQFKALGGERRVLALIADGEPHADDPLEECFPPSLRDSEPIAADVRPGREARADALLKLVAGIIGVSLDELKQRERQRVRARRLRLVLGGVSASVAAALAGTWLYVDDRIERHVEKGRQAMMARDFGRAAPWLVSALSMQTRLPLARERAYLRAMLGITMAQVEQLETIQGFAGELHDSPAVDEGRTRIAIAFGDARIVLAPLTGGSVPRSYPIPEGKAAELRFDGSGQGIYYSAQGGVHHLDLETGASKRVFALPAGAGSATAMPFGRAILSRYPDRHEWVRISDNKVIARIEKPRGGELAGWTRADGRGERMLQAYKDEKGWSVAIVDVPGGGIRHTFRIPFEPRGAQFHAASKRVALVMPGTAGHPGVVGVWDYETGKAAWSVRFPAPFRNVAFSPDGRRLATTSVENRAFIWNADTGEIERILDSDAQIRDAEFFPGGTRLLTLSQDGSPRVWDLATGNLTAKLEGLDSIFARAFPTRDGLNVVAVRNQGTAQFLRWRLDDPRLPRALEGHEVGVTATIPNGAETHLLSTDEGSNAFVWDLRDWRPIARFADSTQPVLSSDGASLFAASAASKKLRVYDVKTRAVRAEILHAFALKGAVGWNARGEIAALDSDGQAFILQADALRMRPLARFPDPGAIEATRDGSLLAVVANRNLQFVDPAQGKRVASHAMPSSDPWGMAFSEKGERFIINFPRDSRLIDVASGKQVALVAAGASGILWSQLLCDGEYAAAALGNYRFQLHDARTGERLRDFDGAGGVIGSLSCDLDAGLVMASDLNGSVTVWRLGSAAPIARFVLSKGRLWSSTWLRSKRSLAIAAEDARIHVVPLPIDSRTVEALEASLRCRVPFRVSGEVLVRDTASGNCPAALN